MDLAAALVPDGEAAEAAEPGQGALDHPAVTAQALARLDPGPGDPRRDAPHSQCPAVGARAVGLVGVQLGRPSAGPPRPAAGAADRLDGVYEVFEEGALIDVGGAEPDGERDAGAVDQQMALATWFAAVRWIRADVFVGGGGASTPPLAGTDALSRLARDQSIASASPRPSNSVVWSRCQTPAACQSRSLRQQVMPLPQPISCGRYSHGMPVFNTKMIPASAARSGTRGRPAFCLSWRGGGSNGATTSQSSSLTSGLAMPHRRHVPGHFC